MKHDPRDHAALELLPGQLERLDVFESLLGSRAVALGAVAPSDADRLWERHILDSLRGVAAIPEGCESALDLGSGAGLPGVPIAIALPTVRVVLAERRRARAAFLELVVSELKLENVQVYLGDAGDLPGPFDVCVARAFGNARAAWGMARDRLREHGTLLYWAGETFEAARDAPEGVLVTLFQPPALANAGPIAIMTQQ